MCNEREVTAFAEYVHTALLALGEPKINFTPEEEIRFWGKVDKSPHPTGCWLWMAGTDNEGYGVYVHRRQKSRAPRIAYRAVKGWLKHEEQACHTCDNPNCVNPDHLYAGTGTENMRDKFRRGRGNLAHGEKHHSSKLTKEQVMDIRAAYKSGGASQHRLGVEYGISQTQVGRLIRGTRRSHEIKSLTLASEALK